MNIAIELGVAALFNAAVLFLVAAGLQLVFGVQRFVNLASGSIYALGAYSGASAVNALFKVGGSPHLMIPVLLGCGVLVGLVGYALERIIRQVYGRDEAFQILITFAFVLIFQDALRFFWGAEPQMIAAMPDGYGALRLGSVSLQLYNLLIIAVSLAIAVSLGWFIGSTRWGHIIRATAENRRMAEAVGINGTIVNAGVFTFGAVLGAIGGALVIPTAAASLELPVELIVEAFAIVVIGGLGSIRGALAGAVIVGAVRAAAISYFPEVETIAIYAVVVGVLLVKPSGIYGKAVI